MNTNWYAAIVGTVIGSIILKALLDARGNASRAEFERDNFKHNAHMLRRKVFKLLLNKCYPTLLEEEKKLLHKNRFDKGDSVILNPSKKDHWLWGWETIDKVYFQREEFGRIQKVEINDSFLHDLVHEKFETWLGWAEIELPDTENSIMSALRAFIADRRIGKGSGCLLYWSYKVDFQNPRINIKYSIPGAFLESYADRDAGAGI